MDRLLEVWDYLWDGGKRKYNILVVIGIIFFTICFMLFIEFWPLIKNYAIDKIEDDIYSKTYTSVDLNNNSSNIKHTEKDEEEYFEFLEETTEDNSVNDLGRGIED